MRASSWDSSVGLASSSDSSSLSSRFGPAWTKTVRGLLTRFFLTTGGRYRIPPDMDAVGGLGGPTLRTMSLR
ncbi:unnamed protein product [Sphagnum jensenii]|uniref:Uncharacterized protein n=1 Tax=Sphagnum jensenii TaxID=128206 RepID=A0ABP0WL78_9BRYO